MSKTMLQTCIKRHIILNIDINKTIIQVDATGGRTFEDVLNSNAAANVYGEINANGKWVAIYGPEEEVSITTQIKTKEQKKILPLSLPSEKIISFEEYIDKLYSAPTNMEFLSIQEKNKIWKKISQARREATGKFTLPHEPGECFAELINIQRRKLQCGCEGRYHSILPSFFVMINALCDLDWSFTLIFRTFGGDLRPVLEEWMSFVQGRHVCKASEAVMRKYQTPLTLFPLTACMHRDDHHTLLCYGPSISASTIENLTNASQVKTTLQTESVITLNTENNINDNNKHSNAIESYVDRTYCSNRRDSISNNMSAARADTDNNRQIKRCTQESIAMSLLEEKIHALHSLPGCEAVEVVNFTTFNEKILAYFAESNHVGGIVDYYPYWAQNAENRTGGKLFPVICEQKREDENCLNNHTDNTTRRNNSDINNNGTNNTDVCIAESGKLRDCYYVFFDDNLFIGDPHSIVDIRNADNGTSILDAYTEEFFCVHVNPYLAITKENYFLDCLTECIHKQQKQ